MPPPPAQPPPQPPRDPRTNDKGTPSPRAFAITTGYIFQSVGGILLLSSCCLWSASGHIVTKSTRPAERWLDYLHGPQLPAALLTLGIATSIVGGAGLIGAGIGLQGERPGSGLAALVVTGTMTVSFSACTACLLAGGQGWRGTATAGMLAALSALLFILSAASAVVLRRFPPPPDQNRVTDDMLRQLGRRRDV